MTQSSFAAALLNPDAATPANLIDPQGRPAPKRFSVYRNNVTSGLIRALEAGFPVIRKLVGPEFFAALALTHLRAHPPRSRIMMLYGDDFPAFLAGFPPVAHLPYLADVARLELAIRHSYHSADAAPIDPAALSVPEDRLLNSRLFLAPSLRLIRSPSPIHAIWQANTNNGPAPQPAAEDVVILRAGFEPAPHLLPPGGAAFLQAILAGRTLAEALAASPDGFDLTAVLALLLSTQSLTGITK